jgi:formimidoylglutamate deiminase
MRKPSAIWVSHLLSDIGVTRDVLLDIDRNGHWQRVTPNTSRPTTIPCIEGFAVPGVVNAHSHAFQRAFAGLAETRTSAEDTFWSWRDRMYRVALALSPDALRAIAAQLYLELLRGGYTHVCEFHYVHHQADGAAYANPFAMSEALIDAAQTVGIGLTLLPVVYETASMEGTPLRDDQRRFRADAAWAMRCAAHANASGQPLVNAGLALHSIRAATPQSIRDVARAFDGPIHLHIAEQTAEVDACLTHTGMRPVQWLVDQIDIDARWHLVHATHVTPSEIERVATRDVSIVLCPTTEANLGDGLTPLAQWLDAGVGVSIGSDSHVCRDVLEEFRLAELGQRLATRKRNVCASPSSDEHSTALRLFHRSARAGAHARGATSAALGLGARADLCVVPLDADALLGIPEAALFDACVFSSPMPRFANVMVAGQWQIQDGQHAKSAAIASAFTEAMRALFAAAP